jgi:broad specificity phosphatase PhoE
MKYIIAVRHAESMGNAGMRTKSPTSNPLTEKGIEQARKTAETIRTLIEPELFVVSKYIRTQQTLEPLKMLYPNVPVETWNIHEFCILNSKKFSDTTEEHRKPFVLRYWKTNDPHHSEGGGAECFIDFVTRIEHMVHALREHRANNIVICSHALVLSGLNFLKMRTNFDPIKGLSLEIQKEIMNDFGIHCREHRIPNAIPYLLKL